jgi:hypothetical protein
MIDDPIVRYALAATLVLLVLATGWSIREHFVRSGALGELIARWREKRQHFDTDDRLSL